MPSIAEWVRWDIPKVCTVCNEGTEFDMGPMPNLQTRIKCLKCNHVRTLPPVLTPAGEEEAKRRFITELVVGKEIKLDAAPRNNIRMNPNIFR